MKILMVSHSINFSGANRSFFGLIEGLAKYHEIIVLTNEEKGILINKLNAINLKHICCKYNWMYAHRRQHFIKQIGRIVIDAKKYYSGGISERMLQKLREERFDIVFTNTSTVDIGVIIAKKLNLPHVWHIREFGKEDFDFIPLISKAKVKKYLNETDKVILISEALKSKYAKLTDVNKLRVVYNGFNIDKLKYLEHPPIDKNNIRVLVTGVVSKGKGQKQAIDAVNILRNKGYSINLYLAGVVDQEYIDNALYGLGDCRDWLHILGAVSDMYGFRKNIDCELICSKSEAFGRVTIEAMLHGIPVIGADRGCTCELISDKNTGLLYHYNDCVNLANKIEEIVNNTDLHDAIIKKAYSFAKEFTIERTVNRVNEIICEIKC